MESRQSETVLLSIELTQTLNLYEETLKKIHNFNKADREPRLRACRDLDTKVLDLRTNYIRELRRLPNGDEKATFVEDLKVQITRYKQLKALYEQKYHAINPDDLENTADNFGKTTDAEQLSPEENLNAVQRMGDAIQDKTDNEIAKMTRAADEGLDIMGAANAAMDEQTEQMDRMIGRYDNILGNAKEAKSESKRLATAMCRDKVVMFLTIMDFLILLAIILVYALWKPESNETTTTAAPPNISSTAGPTEDPVEPGPRDGGLAPFAFFPRSADSSHSAVGWDMTDEAYPSARRQSMRVPEDEDSWSADDLRTYSHEPMASLDTSTHSTLVRNTRRYEVKDRVGIFEGIERYKACANDNNIWSITNPLLPYAVRGPAFGAVDFSHFSEDSEGNVECNLREYGVYYAYEGYRSLVRGSKMIDWV